MLNRIVYYLLKYVYYNAYTDTQESLVPVLRDRVVVSVGQKTVSNNNSNHLHAGHGARAFHIRTSQVLMQDPSHDIKNQSVTLDNET